MAVSVPRATHLVDENPSTLSPVADYRSNILMICAFGAEQQEARMLSTVFIVITC